MRHVLTLIAAPGTVLRPEPYVTATASESWHWLEQDTAVDLYLPTAPSAAQRTELSQLAANQRVDYIVQPTAGREKKLLISDMDSTMIEQECIDELADCVGLKPRVAAITERAMNGELDFPSALRERVALLKDLPESELIRVFDERITLMQGARTLIQTMKARGTYCVLVSGGFTFFTSRVAAKLGMHLDEANQLEIAEGKLTGNVIEPILDKESKLTALKRYTAERKLTVGQTLAIGDGANDLPMLKAAGLGVAYHAKPVVRAEAKAAITHNDLTAILYAQGIVRKDWITD